MGFRTNQIWDTQNLILDLSIFSVYGHGAWNVFWKDVFVFRSVEGVQTP